VQEHDGQELAGLGEDEGDVVYVRERGVAEGRREGGGEGYEEEGGDDGAGGEDGRRGLAGRGAEEEVDVACC
jgi:hypothetical protein